MSTTLLAQLKNSEKKVKLITLDPGHFHAALVQKEMYPNVDSLVYVYSSAGQDLQDHLKRIESYNTRKQHPTHWVEKVYEGNDFLEKMIAEKRGNVVVMSGNNRKKTEYILKTAEAGMNILADKPMCITLQEYEKLKRAFEAAKKNKVLLYDIMTERSEITSILQQELLHTPAIFGILEKGSSSNPAIQMESVHFFYKFVSGAALNRPTWFMDVNQQGEAIVDVATHLVDLVQWEAFPNQSLNQRDLEMVSAKHWATPMSLPQFSAITGQEQFPDFLKNNVKKDTLYVLANGEINYRLKGVNARVRALWNYKAEQGGDTHYSLFRGTKANVEIRQGIAQNFVPQLYIQSKNTDETVLKTAFEKLAQKYPGIRLVKQEKEWLVEIPNNYRNGHEAHFAQVMERFLKYQEKNEMPAWEVPNMLLKYYITTKALDLAKKNTHN